ncbi:hypothetical protein NPIL_60021 [Nephila pilipes]|uniref:Uncharacterized protein n=1 Tax=Nephila pilipes TaxID=299642 RepID=A0A8X6TKQ9_NEPPI|nr:hypothetical protein NPIL_60021 [Nephila pilipes]
MEVRTFSKIPVVSRIFPAANVMRATMFSELLYTSDLIWPLKKLSRLDRPGDQRSQCTKPPQPGRPIWSCWLNRASKELRTSRAVVDRC